MPTTTNGDLAACCKDANNRIVVPLPPEAIAAARNGTPGKQQCTVCGRFHYIFIADPVRFGVTLAPIGPRPATPVTAPILPPPPHDHG